MSRQQSTSYYVPKEMTAQRRAMLSRIYAFIIGYKEGHDGNSPSVREICKATGVKSTSQMSSFLISLEKIGAVELSRSKKGIVIPGGRWTPPQSTINL